jgi:carbon monoxide dehydrogenase subunit G
MASANVSGSHGFPAPPERAWDVLLDPDAIKEVLPGCESFDHLGGEDYRVRIAVNLIAFTATVTGDVTMTDRVPHESYKVLVSGQGSLGSVAIECRMRLSPDGPNSRLDYDIDVDAMGQLGVVGGPVLGPAAKMIVNQFMANMEKQIAKLAASGQT